MGNELWYFHNHSEQSKHTLLRLCVIYIGHNKFHMITTAKLGLKVQNTGNREPVLCTVGHDRVAITPMIIAASRAIVI